MFSFSFFHRYIAVTQPIKYAKHKNSRRVCLTILLVWAISAAIGSPIVLGLNNTPDRLPDLCLFYNSDFIVYSSLSSFYIPCIIMVFLYWNIFKVSKRRKKILYIIYISLPSLKYIEHKFYIYINSNTHLLSAFLMFLYNKILCNIVQEIESL